MRYFLPRLKDVLFLTLFIGVLILGNRMVNADGDLARHIATGRLIIETGKIPLSEPFVYPYFGEPYVPHEWLFGLFSYWIDQLFGLAGIVVLSGVLIALTFTLLYDHIAHITGLRILPFVLVVLGAAVSSLHWIARPHLFSMFFMAVWLIWLDRIRMGGRVGIWKFLLLILIWANLHAEFIMGILITLAFLVGCLWERLVRGGKADVIGRRLGIILACSIPVTLINPAGLQPWLRVFNYLGNDYLMTAINETNSPDFHRPEFLVLLSVIILSLVLLALRKNQYPRVEILILAGVTWMTLASARNVHLYGVLFPFSILPAIESYSQVRWIARMDESLAKVEALLKPHFSWIVSVLLIVIPLLVSSRVPLYCFDPLRFPVDAVRWLNEHPLPGNGFNAFDWGGYLELYGGRGTRVFIDSMADHKGEISQDYLQLMDTEGDWQDVISHYQIKWAILPTDSGLAEALQKDENWVMLYIDQTAVILGN